MFGIGVSVEGLDVAFAEELEAVGEALGIGKRGTFAIGAEKEGLKEEEKFPEGVGCCFMGRGIFDVIVWWESRLEESFEEGMSCLVKGDFVVAFKVWVEIVAEGGGVMLRRLSQVRAGVQLESGKKDSRMAELVSAWEWE